MEIRIQGRGGQGTVTLAALIADAAFRDGRYALAFPTFGTERTGAPVAAFVRLGSAPILDRSEVRRPDVVIVQDPTLASVTDVSVGLTPGGLILLNAERIPPRLMRLSVASIPATRIALRHLGAPKTSTAMLGFFAAMTGAISFDAVVAAIESRFGGSLAGRNVEIAREAYSMSLEWAA